MSQVASISRTLRLATIATAAILTFGAPLANAQKANKQAEPERATKKVESLSKAVYDKLLKAQEAIDGKDVAGALRILNGIDRSKLSGYEQSNLDNYYGFAHYSNGDNRSALRSYEAVVNNPDTEPNMRTQVLYTVASLHAQNENWDQTIRYLNEWFTLTINPTPAAYILLASAYQSKGDYPQTIKATTTAIDLAKEKGQQPKESWWNLLYYSYYQTENFPKVRDTLKILIAGWPKKAYWLQLGAVYSELGDEKNFLAAYEAAFLQGMLESESEIVTYAQLLLQQEVPHKAAVVLDKGMTDGVITKTAKNYRLLSQAWSLAQEDEKAIGPLTQAAKLSDDGELYARLAVSYLNLDRFDDCVGAGRSGISKGGLKKPMDVRMTVGQCLYNQEKYSASKDEFLRVVRNGSDKDKRIAQQWVRVIDSDMERLAQLRRALASN
ncbi:MAG: hypothetical protein AAGC71_04785 [Pseudomonadota bacterium]